MPAAEANGRFINTGRRYRALFMELDQIFAQEQPAPEQTQDAPAVEPTQVEPAVEAPVSAEPVADFKEDATGRLHAPDGKFAPKQPTGETNAAAEQKQVPIEALIAERSKRQALEAQMAQRQAPKFWEDPEAAIQQIQETTHRALTTKLLDMSEYNARMAHPDYEEKLNAFEELLNKPGMQYLRDEVAQHPNPAEYAYQIASNHLTYTAVGSLDKYREQILATEREKIRAEVLRQIEEEKKRAESIPPTLSEMNGAAGGNRTPAWTGPTSLDTIFARGK